MTPERLSQIRESAELDSLEDIGDVVGRRGILELLDHINALQERCDLVRDSLRQQIICLDWVIDSLSRLAPNGDDDDRIRVRRVSVIEAREALRRIMSLTDDPAS